MNYVASVKVSEVPEGGMTAVSVEGKPILLANVGGAIYAIGQMCPHMGADLCKGRLAGAIVTCPKHAAGFDVKTGAAVDPAKVLFLKMKTKDAASYPVKVEGGQVLVGV